MGVLYARVGGAWVPIIGGTIPTGSSLVADPAYAGPRKDGATTTAQFGHTSLAGQHGLSVFSSGKIVAAVRDGDWFEVQHVPVGGTGPTWTGGFGRNAGGGLMQVGDIMVGVHPVIGLNGMWLNSQAGGNDYKLAFNAAITYLNGSSEWRLRIANSDILTATSGVIYPKKPMQAYFNLAGGDWSNSHFVAWADAAGSGNGARVSLHQAGYWAPQLRASQWNNEGVSVVNANAGAYVPVYASAFTVTSSVDFKTDIREARSIGLERERIVVRHDPRSDVVPEVDVMALRPVAFRPKTKVARPDGTEWPADSWPAIDGNRERLGLVAEEVTTVIPSAVSHGAVGNVVGIDYAQITVALLAHVQRLTEEVATLRYRVAELEGTS